jgi:hypothetical protein
MISGWLFDAYPLDNKMVLWIKQEDGNTIRLQDSRWGHSIYVASDNNSSLKLIVDDNSVALWELISIILILLLFH